MNTKLHRGRRRAAGRRGFSLVEVAITISIVALGALATISMLTFARLHNDLEMERARAYQIVMQEIEINRYSLYPRIRTDQFATIWDNGTPNDTADDTNGKISVTVLDAYTGAVLTAAPNPAVLVQVAVTLEWTPRGRIGRKKLADGTFVDRTYRETVLTYIAPN